MKKIFCIFLLFAFVFTNVSFTPVMAAAYQEIQLRNEVIYPQTTQRVTQTIIETETVTTESTTTKVYEEPIYEEVVNTQENVYQETEVTPTNKKNSAGEIIGTILLGTLLIGGVIALAAIDDEPPHHHKKPHRGSPSHKGGHKPPHRR